MLSDFMHAQCAAWLFERFWCPLAPLNVTPYANGLGALSRRIIAYVPLYLFWRGFCPVLPARLSRDDFL